MELEQTLAKLYYRFVHQAGLTPALSRKLTGMARDRILAHGTHDWTTTYGTGLEGLSKFIGEAVNVLSASPENRHYVLDDPYVRGFVQDRPPPPQWRFPFPKSRQRASSTPALLRPLPSLLAPEQDGAVAPPAVDKARRKALKKERQDQARAYAQREREIAEAERRGDAVPAPLPAPVPEPAPAPKKEKKAKKPKAKKETAPAVDEDMALLDAEIARNAAEAQEQEQSQADELARLRAEALAGDPEAQATLDRLYDIVSRAKEQNRRGRR